MIPYLVQPSVSLGPITIHAFGVIVALAVLAGLELGRRRFRHLGLDARLGEGMAWYAIVGGFLGAHLFSVIFYFPQKVAENPLVLFKLWEDISSFGSILGGFAAIWLYFHFKAPQLGMTSRWAYLDVAAYVFPVSLAIGRIACSLAHDHPGTVTTFPLAVSLGSDAAREFLVAVYRGAGRLAELPPPEALGQFGFHDLGWYEFLYLGLVVVPTVLLLGRKARPTGTFLVVFIVLYTPVRFALDFLRVGDVRYAGLTPAQWTAAGLFLVAVAAWVKWVRHPATALAETGLSSDTPLPVTRT